MIEDARTGEAAAYRGFLFSDLRGFTAFAERHGNAAAASVVGRFLEIARTAIARHSGAEIKTEGDAIHAVFPSASAAVICGLEIVESATDLNPGQPELPIGIGVGIHAGEAVETAEGFIGSAVNLAARVCAIARPGEVLVTSTVKGITQASIPVGFVNRGRRRLKGIREPVEVFAITRDPTAKSPRVLPQRMLLGAAGVAAAAVIIATAVLGRSLLPPGASPTPTSGPTPQRVVVGPLPIGRYETQSFQPPVSFDIVDQGWTANRDVPDMLGLVRDAAPRGGVSFLRVQEVIANPCVEGGDVGQTAPPAGDLLSTLGGLQHVTLANSQPTSVGGHLGRQVDVTVSASAQAACGGLVGGGGVALFATGDEVWRAAPGERFRLIVVDVGGQPVAIVSSTDWTQTPSVQELESLLELAQRVLDSVVF